MSKSLATEYEDGKRNKIKKKNVRNYFFIVAIFLADDTNALHMFTLPGRQTKWL